MPDKTPVLNYQVKAITNKNQQQISPLVHPTPDYVTDNANEFSNYFFQFSECGFEEIE